MGSKKQAEASRNMAKWMKDKGITRTTTRCPVGYHTISLSDLHNHLRGNCKGPRRKKA